MNPCPGCQYLLHPTWNVCRKCGERVSEPTTRGAPHAERETTPRPTRRIALVLVLSLVALLAL
ncbi:MAG: hypothetical protein ACRDV7_01995 [Acidimicrobiia bacterium]